MTREGPLEGLRRESATYGWGLRLGFGAGSVSAFAPPERGVLVLGPPRCGKTSSVVVPNVLSAGGPVISASTKPDVLAATAPSRRRVGECLVFDPSGRTALPPGVEPVSWSPLHSSLDWDGATAMAETMVLVARPGARGGESAHWTERAAALLAPAFHGAALEGMGMASLLSLVNRRRGQELVAALARHDSELPLDLLQGVLATEERELSGIWSTASSVLSAYRSERAVRSAAGRPVTFEDFMRSEQTLYVCSPSEVQRQAAPIVAALLADARAAGYRAHAEGSLGHSAGLPPLLLALDELANIAPLPDLPGLVSEGGSQGVVVLACLQDLSQARERWGPLAEGFLSLFNCKLIFPGIGDVRTLQAVSLLAGDHQVPSRSVTSGARLGGLPGLLGRHAPPRVTRSTRTERRLPADQVAQGLPGHALCLDGAVPSFVRTPRFDEEPRLRAASMAGQELPQRARATPEIGGRGGLSR